ncbi:glycosyltransferase [Salegentibacter sp. BLCTC]|uniref:glycosyltransferase n=1 Tax=Salegentibacter sp. BLCTC TaxID=2697368 RepID=UPI00187B3E6A|nr:glycosyltransferase [Salegentibacter sp. BLCTC]MBE7639821.1 glycosyltransferase [Salegentibacter sp. BLCTC]
MFEDKVSIIIPCYNDHLYIQEAVNSALNQTYENIEIIVIDDGSNKQTKRILNRLKPKIDKLITQGNLGASAARNNGIAASSGKFIMILDSDDYYESEFCTKAINVFNNKTGVKLVSCYAQWFSEENARLFKPTGGILADFLLKNCVLSVIFRKKDFDLVGGYDVNMQKGFEDWEFYIRLLKSGGHASIIPEVLFNYRNKQNSRNEKANLKKYDILEYIYNKHADLYKEHFSLFIHEWLKSNRRSEAFKQQVMDSLDYKIGNKILKPFRFLGLFKRKQN